MTGEQRVLELRHDRVLVAHDTGEQRLAGGDACDGVAADLLLHRQRRPARRPELTERAGTRVGVGRHGSTLPRLGPPCRGATCHQIDLGTSPSTSTAADTVGHDRYAATHGPERHVAGVHRRRRASAAAASVSTSTTRSGPIIPVPGHWRTVADVRRLRRSAAVPRSRSTSIRPPTTSASSSPSTGVFYQADVWLDGAYLGDPEGYFFPHRFDITSLARVVGRPRAGGRGDVLAAARPEREAQHHRRAAGRRVVRSHVEPRRPVAAGRHRRHRAGAHRPLPRAVPRRQRHPRAPSPACAARQRRGAIRARHHLHRRRAPSPSRTTHWRAAATRSRGTSTSPSRSCGGRGRWASNR